MNFVTKFVAILFWFRSYILLNLIVVMVRSSGFYNELKMSVSTSSIAKTMKGLTPTTCLSRCRRSKNCLHAALRKLNRTTTATECLQLTDIGAGEIELTLLKEILIPGTLLCSLKRTTLLASDSKNYSSITISGPWKERSTITKFLIKRFAYSRRSMIRTLDNTNSRYIELKSDPLGLISP